MLLFLNIFEIWYLQKKKKVFENSSTLGGLKFIYIFFIIATNAELSHKTMYHNSLFV